jgi:hypothetical protein
MWTAFDSLRIWPRGGLLWTLMNLPAQKKTAGTRFHGVIYFSCNLSILSKYWLVAWFLGDHVF